MFRSIVAGSVLLLACNPVAAATQTAPAGIVAPSSDSASHSAKVLVERDTLIRLMVLNEVSTRSAKPGDRFLLRVDEPVVVGGHVIVPVGAKAWGEVLDAEKSGAVGKSGRIGAKLLSVEVGGIQVPISGERKTDGEKGTTQVAMAALALGPFALFARGNNARLKAGEIFSAYFDADMLFDPASSTMVPAGGAQ